MADVKHTPGPWECGEIGFDPTLAKRTRTLRAGAVILGELDSWLDRYAAESEANARLIAAAPEILKALKRVRVWIDTSVPIGTEAATTMLGVVLAAIAKAEGRTDAR